MAKKFIVLCTGAALIVWSGFLAFFENASEVVYGSVLVAGLLSIPVASVIPKGEPKPLLRTLAGIGSSNLQLLAWTAAALVALTFLPRNVSTLLAIAIPFGGLILLFVLAGRKMLRNEAFHQ